MKCAYESVRRQQNIERFCEKYGTEFLKYADASLALNMHDLFRFGSSKRLPELFDSMNPRLNAQMQAMVERDDEALWTTTQETHWWTDRKIKHATGWSPCKVAEELCVPDAWTPARHTPRENRMHRARRNFVDAMDVKIGLYWHMVLDYLIAEHGFGAERLDRLYRALRMDYIVFAAEFIKGTPAAEANMARMVRDKHDRVRLLGLEFDYGDKGRLKIRKEGTND